MPLFTSHEHGVDLTRANAGKPFYDHREASLFGRLTKIWFTRTHNKAEFKNEKGETGKIPLHPHAVIKKNLRIVSLKIAKEEAINFWQEQINALQKQLKAKRLNAFKKEKLKKQISELQEKLTEIENYKP